MNSPPGRSNSYLSVHAVNIFVRDQERSLRFYLDQLGFTLALDARLQPGQRWVAVAPADGATVLSLVQPPPDSEQAKLIGRATQVVFVTDDVPATFREWTARGVRFRSSPRLRRIKYQRPPDGSSGEPPVWGAVFARFEDPDHNTFALISLDEVSKAIEARRRAAAEKAEAERRAARELDIAREVQSRLFPQRLPRLRTIEYAGTCTQARQVGGDYYDFLDLGRERLGLVVGDIAGKGIAAALLMANLQANLRSQCATALEDPRRFLRSVNQLFYENTADSSYATLFFAEYDDTSRCLRYANCGHLPGLLFHRDGTLDRLASTGTVLGLFPEWDCTIDQRPLRPGDTLAFYTDGITECCDEQGEEYGEWRLIEVLRPNAGLPPEALLATVLEDLRRFSPHEQQDDVTLIVARCR